MGAGSAHGWAVNIVVGAWEGISRKDSLPAKVSIQLTQGEERCLRNVKKKKKAAFLGQVTCLLDGFED